MILDSRKKFFIVARSLFSREVFILARSFHSRKKCIILESSFSFSREVYILARSFHSRKKYFNLARSFSFSQEVFHSRKKFFILATLSFSAIVGSLLQQSGYRVQRTTQQTGSPDTQTTPANGNCAQKSFNV